MIIIVHQLPSALGVASGGTSVVQRLHSVSHELGHVSAWSSRSPLGTLVVLVVGEKLDAKLPVGARSDCLATVLAAVLSSTTTE